MLNLNTSGQARFDRIAAHIDVPTPIILQPLFTPPNKNFIRKAQILQSETAASDSWPSQQIMIPLRAALAY